MYCNDNSNGNQVWFEQYMSAYVQYGGRCPGSVRGGSTPQLQPLIKYQRYLSIVNLFYLKGTYYAKITFIRCLNTVVWPQCVKTTSL